MPKKNISGRSLSEAITSEDILGKEVIDVDGDFIGIAEKVLINPKNFNSLGISIDKGFFKRGLTIGKGYIERVTPHAVFLKINVPYLLKGKTVFDKDGKKVGVVSSIDLHGAQNRIKELHVKSQTALPLLKKEIVIPNNIIRNIGDNVILKLTREQVMKKLGEKRQVQSENP